MVLGSMSTRANLQQSRQALIGTLTNLGHCSNMAAKWQLKRPQCPEPRLQGQARAHTEQQTTVLLCVTIMHTYAIHLSHQSPVALEVSHA